ncbi:MAG TPA: VWA domain-containing protein, partial [Thermoanaerobaculia bacterium]
AAALACLPAAGVAAAEAGERPAPPERIFIDRVEVNVVNVEVFVTDRQGRRVSDLGREDFEVRVDGRPVAITNFYASAAAAAPQPADDAGGIATIGLPVASLPAAEAGTAAEVAAVAREQRLNLMVYVDHTFTRAANRKRLLDHLRGFLATELDEHTWVMLVGYNGAVHVETPLTRDSQAIAAGLDALGGYAGGPGPLSMDRVARVLQNSEEEAFPSLVSSFMQQEEAKLRLSVRALAESLALFAGLPGRKAVLHVSDGLPMEVMLAAQMMLGDEVLVSGLRNGERRLYGDLVRTAQAHQIAFYPIDTRGPFGEDYSSAELQPFATVESPDRSNAGFAAADTLNRQEPLLEMAAATGGTAILNTFNFARALETVAIDFGSFYSLGFAAPHAGDGRRHAIDVRVKRPGLRVRHREGYVDKPLVERVGDRTLSFLQLEMESNPLGARIGFGHPQRDGRRWIVPLLVRVPAEGVTLLPEGDSLRGRLHFFVAVRDDRGRVSDLTHIPHPLTIPAGGAEPDAADLGLGINLEVRPGTWTVAVGVWDEIGGAESYLRETIEIVEPEREPGGRRGRRSR